MNQPLTFQKLVLGNQPIETEAEKRKLLLGAYLILMYLGIDAFFFIVNLFNPFGSVISLFAGALVSVVCLILIKKKWINTAILLHMVRVNVLAYYFAANDFDVYATGSYIYFIPSCVGALAIFGYQERWKALGLSVVSVILFLMALFDWSRFTPEDAHFYFIFNFLIVLTIVCLVLLFFDRMVTGSEKRILQKNKELLKANSELDRFVYSVSHDLRAPLSSILGLVNIYEFAAKEEERREIIHHIHNRALKLDEFISEILDYARTTRLPVAPTPMDLRALVFDVMDNLRYVKGFDKIRFTFNGSPDATIESDPERWKVIFNNLLSNAIKYLDTNKEQPFVEVTLSKQPAGITLTITDNGIGIRPEYLSKVFGMFYRANDLVEGSGLGLYIVKEAVNSLSGYVEVTSEHGHWTTFKIILPPPGILQ